MGSNIRRKKERKRIREERFAQEIVRPLVDKAMEKQDAKGNS